jgi:ferredoxin
MKVRIEADRCDGFGNCAIHLPEVFRLDDSGFAYVEGDGTVPDGLEDRARHAVVDCPKYAIRETD